jgi:hypothetical protein
MDGSDEIGCCKYHNVMTIIYDRCKQRFASDWEFLLKVRSKKWSMFKGQISYLFYYEKCLLQRVLLFVKSFRII